MTTFSCPVCGFDGLKERPRASSGAGSLEICPSCGFQFGFDDDSEGISDEDWRARWVAGGMQWALPTYPKPDGWDPKAQLERLLSSG